MTTEAPATNLEATKDAYAKWLPRVLGMPRWDGAIDLDGGLERAEQLAALAKSEPAKSRLALLPDALFKTSAIDDLESLVSAIRHVETLKSGTETKLSDAVLDEAEGLRGTLHKLLDYHFGEDAAVGSELADGRPKKSGFKIAAALARLATLADERSEALSADTKYWRPTLVADARKAAEAALAAGGVLAEREILDVKRRAFALLEGVFGEVRTAVSFVMRHDAAYSEALPQLRKTVVRAKKADVVDAPVKDA